MTHQCPRCLSSMFKLLIAGDGNRPNCCDFCKDFDVQHVPPSGSLRSVRLTPREPHSNVVQLRPNQPPAAVQ